MGFDMSQDRLCGVRTAINVGLKKRKIRPSDLSDAFGEWMPLAEDVEGTDAARDEGDGVEFQAETGEK
jgi:hypothetical protein